MLPENRAALARRHPELLGRLERSPWSGRTVASAEAVEPRLAAIAADRDLRRTRVLVAVGLGQGGGRELLAADALRPERWVLVVEPSLERLHAALSRVDLSALLAAERVTWMVGLEAGALRAELDAYCGQVRFLYFARAYSTLSAWPEDEAEAEALAGAEREVFAAARARCRLAGNDTEDALIGLDNILGNLGCIARRPSARRLAGVLRGHPAVVAAAGPSLHDALPALSSLPEGVALFCPDTSFRILQGAGIRPHVVTSRERQLITIEHFEGVDTEGVALAACPVLRPRILEGFKGPVGFVYRSTDLPRWLDVEEPPLEFAGSSGNLAFRMAALAGCDPILLVGQDLCFAADGATHAPGAAHGDRQAAHEATDQLEVPGNAGGVVRTNAIWASFLRCYELDLAEHAGTVINTSVRGARIAGTAAEPLSEALVRARTAARADEAVRPLVLAALAPRDDAATRAERLQDRRRASLEDVLHLRSILEVGRRYAALPHRLPVAARPDLSLLMGRDPFATLEGVRQKLLAARRATFVELLEPIVQPAFITLEQERYLLEVEAGSATELARGLMALFRRWFDTMDGILAEVASRLDPEGGASRAAQRRGPKGKKKKRRAS